MLLLRFLAFICVSSLLTAAALSHELWLEPKQFEIEADQSIEADIRVGQAFKGSSLSFNPNRFERFDIATDTSLAPIEGRLGDMPAIRAKPLGDGLNILVHHASDATLTYKEWEKFVAFVDHKSFDSVIDAHTTRGLPQTDFKEVYSRYAKSLIAVGEGLGRDRAFGLETEIVALANPYTEDVTDGLQVQILYQGTPRANAQVEIFERAADGTVLTTTTRTGPDGIASIPVKPGRTYMLDAVLLREPAKETGAETGAVWESLWANLTFKMPD